MPLLLVCRSGADPDLVAGPAAERLRPFEGIGALLRFTRAEIPPDRREATA